jgi:hypothetical protein
VADAAEDGADAGAGELVPHPFASGCG